MYGLGKQDQGCMEDVETYNTIVAKATSNFSYLILCTLVNGWCANKVKHGTVPSGMSCMAMAQLILQTSEF